MEVEEEEEEEESSISLRATLLLSRESAPLTSAIMQSCSECLYGKREEGSSSSSRCSGGRNL